MHVPMLLTFSRPAPKPAIQLVQQLYAILKDAVTGSFVGDGALSCEHLLFILAQSIVTLVATLRDKELVKTILLEDMVEILRYVLVEVSGC